MKKLSKITAVILCLLMLISLLAVSAAAEELDPAEYITEATTAGDIYGNTDDVEYTGEGTTDAVPISEDLSYSDIYGGENVSEFDLSDLLRGTGSSLADRGGYPVKLTKFGFQMTVPMLDSIITAEQPPSTMVEIGASMLPDQLLNGDSYGGMPPLLVYATNSDQSAMVAVAYETNNYAKMIGSYSNLTPADLETMMDSFSAQYGIMGNTESQGVESAIINGNTYIHFFDASGTGTEANVRHEYHTVVGGVSYTIYLIFSGELSAEDNALIEDCINSIKFSGSSILSPTPSSVKWLTVAVVILAGLSLLMGFFLVRFSLFSKAAGSSFNIIGFDIPKTSDYEDEFADDDFDDDKDDDKDDDDDVSDSEEG